MAGLCDVRELLICDCYRSLIADNLCYINPNLSLFAQSIGLDSLWRFIESIFPLPNIAFLFIESSNESSSLHYPNELSLFNADLIKALGFDINLKELRLA
jgi:hypothetical protein